MTTHPLNDLLDFNSQQTHNRQTVATICSTHGGNE